MSDWKRRFAQKLDLVKDASRDRFEQVADKALADLFNEIREFTSGQGFSVAKPIAKPGLRAYRFSIAENCYALLTFRLGGLEHAELQVESVVPGLEKSPSYQDRVDLSNFDAAWARRVFERALDQFLDAYLHNLSGRGNRMAELIEA